MTDNVMNIDVLRQQWGVLNASNGLREEEKICEDFNDENSTLKNLIEEFTNFKLGNLSKYPGRTKTDVYAEVIDSNENLNLQIKMYTPPKKNRHSGGQVGKMRWTKL